MEDDTRSILGRPDRYHLLAPLLLACAPPPPPPAPIVMYYCIEKIITSFVTSFLYILVNMLVVYFEK